MNITGKNKFICAIVLFGLIMCILVTIYKDKRSSQVPEMSAEESENINVFVDDVVTNEAGDYVLPDDATLKQMTRLQLIGVFWNTSTVCRRCAGMYIVFVLLRTGERKSALKSHIDRLHRVLYMPLG
ncbi:hypothetical protein DPMN_031062 [Dreissena polymorpha]|uniref:Uncharacterized protein n=1 Tax=Dreissena polymorpha TaxID=45954 RepID=A0A9D4M162_DREPO|nr:hypothetical protein DPMN_031062 [Dreissena polymorpha]